MSSISILLLLLFLRKLCLQLNWIYIRRSSISFYPIVINNPQYHQLYFPSPFQSFSSSYFQPVPPTNVSILHSYFLSLPLYSKMPLTNETCWDQSEFDSWKNQRVTNLVPFLNEWMNQWTNFELEMTIRMKDCGATCTCFTFNM